MGEAVLNKTLDGYEDDFEKDLDWLISEESRSEDQGPDYDDIEAEIDKELEESEKESSTKEEQENSHKGKEKRRRTGAQGAGDDKEEEEEERWPSPMAPLEYDPDRHDSPSRRGSPSLAPPPAAAADEQTDEEKKYIQDKIQQANRELRDQEPADASRRRRLHFKDKLVDLVVPPREYPPTPAAEAPPPGAGDAEVEGEVSGRLSELNISPRKESAAAAAAAAGGTVADGLLGGDPGGEGGKEGRVLVEKDGKFDLVSLKEVESHGLLPPLAKHSRDNGPRSSPRPAEASLERHKTRSSSSSAFRSVTHQSVEHLRAPRPPSQPRGRPSSASRGVRGSLKQGARRRVQSAAGSPSRATCTVSPLQKEALQKAQQRRERLAREVERTAGPGAEQRKQEEEEQKRQDNELAFRAWLKRKGEQVRAERRVHRAQEMERQNGCRVPVDGEQAFRFWLRRKQEQQLREREMEDMRRVEEEGGYVLHNRQECEQAFKEWLKQKRAEKRASQRASRQLSRRLLVEDRRARRMQDLMCSVNEAKPFRFTGPLSYRF
ncbi:coiled-coil domain-containing protein 181 isoform X1 [Gadus macrocephalus]|uniref:coiled-coil domain-containing protein 181 isoform X1 n=1 Tax=Gadus macrocephalus TaxID=80720 RepID=UPI0028CB1373|nr:coiled-coil domain-containing protein 181 isoform X1 [Gadus macrocephalus]